ALEMLAYSNFYEGKPQAALAYFETILEMFNIYSIDDYIEKVKHNGYSNTLRIDSNTKELRTTPNFTASLAFAYHYSGFYEDSYKLFEHASLAVSKVSQGIGYSNDRSSLPGWNMFPSPKTTYVYWEYRSMMIESLFLQKKHDLALQ